MAAEEVSYQTDWMCKAVLQLVLLKNLPEVTDVAGGEAQRVQLRQFGVCWNPRQTRFQCGESFAEHSHPCPLPGVGSISLRLPRLILVRLGEPPVFLLDPPLHTIFFLILV